MYTCTVMLHKVTEVPILYIIYRSYSNEICRMALSLHLLHIILKVSLKINLINLINVWKIVIKSILSFFNKNFK